MATGTWKEYRKRNASGAVYDDPCVAVGAGRFDGVGARAEAESKCKAIRHGVKSLRRLKAMSKAKPMFFVLRRSRTNAGSRRH